MLEPSADQIRDWGNSVTQFMFEYFGDLLVALQRDGSSYLSNATLGSRFALRGCVLNYRTTLCDMEILLDDYDV